MMSEIFSGKELLDRWGIRDFELFEYVSKGKLIPHDRFGKLLRHPYLLSETRLEELKIELKSQQHTLQLAEAYKIPLDNPQRQSLEAAIASKKQNALEAIAWLKAELYESEATPTESQGWKGCELPDEKQRAEHLIDLLTNSLYHKEDVFKVEQERNQQQQKRAIAEIGVKRTNKRPRTSQIHKANCRAVAFKLWTEDPSITISEMILSDEIARACEPRTYGEKTLREWIKDLCPNRAPGRRTKGNRLS
jgi:hypothetical protein